MTPEQIVEQFVARYYPDTVNDDKMMQYSFTKDDLLSLVRFARPAQREEGQEKV